VPTRCGALHTSSARELVDPPTWMHAVNEALRPAVTDSGHREGHSGTGSGVGHSLRLLHDSSGTSLTPLGFAWESSPPANVHDLLRYLSLFDAEQIPQRTNYVIT
jgi:hypothetical protein